MPGIPWHETMKKHFGLDEFTSEMAEDFDAINEGRESKVNVSIFLLYVRKKCWRRFVDVSLMVCSGDALVIC